jgi:hypothetical protein
LAQILNLEDAREPSVVYHVPLPPDYDRPTAIDGVWSPPRASMPAHILDIRPDAPTVALIGDSYSLPWRKFFALEAGALGWSHVKWLDELSLIERLKPRLVVFQVAERHL